MPTITILDGVKIECFSADHHPPHIHASYGEHEVLLKIENGDTYRGSLPGNKMKIAKSYIKENKDKLSHLFEKLNPQLSRNEK